VRRIIPLLLVLVVAACASTAGKPMTVEARPGDATWFVERHPQDGRDLASIIAGALRSRGVDAYSGTPEQRPEGVDILVTYQDRWMWDMRMYLLDLRIDVQDANSHALIAFGQSYQDSLAALGKNQLDIVNRALDEILPRPR
jgi:hypothetical protein